MKFIAKNKVKYDRYGSVGESGYLTREIRKVQQSFDENAIERGKRYAKKVDVQTKTTYETEHDDYNQKPDDDEVLIDVEVGSKSIDSEEE